MALSAELKKLDDTGLFDITTFLQVLEMDDDDERDFSKSIVFDFFEQAESTFIKMEDALSDKDLPALSSLGHFLKGSSATLGLQQIRNSCEKIQHLGSAKDEAGLSSVGKDEALSKLQSVIDQVKVEYDEAKAVLESFYHE